MGGGGGTRLMHSRSSHMNIDPRIPIMPGRSMSISHKTGGKERGGGGRVGMCFAEVRLVCCSCVYVLFLTWYCFVSCAFMRTHARMCVSVHVRRVFLGSCGICVCRSLLLPPPPPD